MVPMEIPVPEVPEWIMMNSDGQTEKTSAMSAYSFV
jgi:hypothetical protein